MDEASCTLQAVDAGITTRLERRIRADFADADSALGMLGGVESGAQDRERVLAAVVIGARGDLQQLEELVKLSHVDWRDVLVGGGLGNAEWPQVLDRCLGTVD